MQVEFFTDNLGAPQLVVLKTAIINNNDKVVIELPNSKEGIELSKDDMKRIIRVLNFLGQEMQQ